MITCRQWLIVALILLLVPVVSHAGSFDGTTPLVCAVSESIECGPGGECLSVTPESLDFPRFFLVNFETKKMTTLAGIGVQQTSDIERVERVEKKLILQGAEDSREDVRDAVGWSMAISETSGMMTLTASGDEAGFVLFGACIPQDLAVKKSAEAKASESKQN